MIRPSRDTRSDEVQEIYFMESIVNAGIISLHYDVFLDELVGVDLDGVGCLATVLETGRYPIRTRIKPPLNP